MNFEAKSFDHEKHYPVIANWFEARGLPCPAIANLPHIGCLVESAGKPIAAGFMFQTETPNVVIGNLISDRSADKQTRSNAVDFLILNLGQAAKYMGKKAVLCSSNFEPAKVHFEKLGFEVVEENVTIYRREI